ncbi:MAG: DKNYY domain-containing protein [Ignavibacteriae bacterium]|nr:DKNYY domain-containing protein [Ignavibacteriota bacterium]
MRRKFLIISLIIVAVLLVCGAGVYTYTYLKKNSSTQAKDEQGYVIKEGKVYYRTTMDVSDGADGYHTIVNDQELKGVNAKTFTMLDPYWAKDVANLYYMGQTVVAQKDTAPIDLSTFSLIQGVNGIGRDTHFVYLASPNQDGWVYKIVAKADPATFAFVEGGHYAKDKKNLYYLDLPFDIKKIEGADGPSFVVLGQCAAVEVSRAYYGWDAKSVIAGDKVLQGIDRDSFRIVASYDNGADGMYVAGSYAVDKNHVYKNCGEIVPTGNPKTCSSNNLKACE